MTVEHLRTLQTGGPGNHGDAETPAAGGEGTGNHGDAETPAAGGEETGNHGDAATPTAGGEAVQLLLQLAVLPLPVEG